MHDDRGPIELGLQEALIGVVADGIRHHAVAIGDHAVGGNDGVALDAVRSDHPATIAGPRRQVIANEIGSAIMRHRRGTSGALVLVQLKNELIVPLRTAA